MAIYTPALLKLRSPKLAAVGKIQLAEVPKKTFACTLPFLTLKFVSLFLVDSLLSLKLSGSDLTGSSFEASKPDNDLVSFYTKHRIIQIKFLLSFN